MKMGVKIMSISSIYDDKYINQNSILVYWRKQMSHKADSPRCTMKVPVPFRDRVRKNAQKKGMNMLDYLVSTIPVEEKA